VELSDDLQDPKKGREYYADLLEVRRLAPEYGLPFWSIVRATRFASRPPSRAGEPGLQAYTTLAAGAAGVSWFKYYQGPYAYAPSTRQRQDRDMAPTCKTVNRQVRVLVPILNRADSTVFSSRRRPVPDLPLCRAGRGACAIRGLAPRLLAHEPAHHGGEFQDEQGMTT